MAKVYTITQYIKSTIYNTMYKFRMLFMHTSSAFIAFSHYLSLCNAVLLLSLLLSHNCYNGDH